MPSLRLPPSAANIKEALRKYYGYSEFRPGQEESVGAILSGRDAVVLMPTGGGKSLCFQLPALVSEGCCIVVSPLIALMNDQVEALRANGLPARAVNSMNLEADNQAAYEAAARGQLKLLYISPERLLADLDHISHNIRISFVAIDEAHCISQWGHDFRPVYTELKRIRQQWPHVPVMALTATADRLTRDDISGALGLKDPYSYIGSFDRPNLSLQVVTGASQRERLKTIASLVDKYRDDCGIVYCLSRKKTEAMAAKLEETGIRTGCYHAGLTPEQRHRVQRDFVNGKLQAICATIAFGMGIDKSNVRWVVHNNIPGNIESYYQEIGRAGRDGLPAETILFYSYSDIITRRSFAEESGRTEINSSKLDFMQRYAEANVCRRRILMSYFSEDFDHDCGNCDNCRNPRPKLDATILAQKALSAILRTGSSEGMNVIIDILRGSGRKQLFDKGYDRLPTYGVGRDLSAQEWHAYILQMIQLGLIEVAYEDNFHLRPTEAGLKVVRRERPVELAVYVRPDRQTNKEPSRARRAKSADPELTLHDRILQNLKAQRRKLADSEQIADYMVLSDATLHAIADKNPAALRDLVGIEGLSLVKLAKYYRPILLALKHARNQSGSLPAGLSEEVSGILFNGGMEVEEIAAARSLSASTVVGHLCRLYKQGENIDLWRIVPQETYYTVKTLIDTALSDLAMQGAEANQTPGQYLSSVYGIPGSLYGRVNAIRQALEKK